MRFLCFCLLAALLAPGAAHAAGASMVSRDLAAPAGAVNGRFDLVGLHWRGAGRVEFRTRAESGRWSPWREADADEHVQPSPARGWTQGEPYWTARSVRLEYRTAGSVRAVRAHLVRSRAAPVPSRRVSVAGSPRIVRRSAWAADEEVRRAAPRYARAVRLAIVHHTAGTNDYEPAEAAAIVLGIELYHVKANGWNDIGYNFLVDRFGRVYEGRYGGVARNVVGAHAAGFNTGSVGVAVLGTHGKASITPAARAALVRLLAWRLDVAHVDPLSTPTLLARGNERFRPGTPVVLRAISAHRDTGLTECPGDALYVELDAIARDVAGAGLPKLYEPSVSGRIGGPIRFAARLSAAAPWTVTITDPTAKVVARGSGRGPVVDWTWDSSAAAGTSFRWTIEAGLALRPASGAIGAGAAPPPPPPPVFRPPALLAEPRAVPSVVSPNGDGQADETTVSYTLARAASVTARVLDAAGAEVVTLFADQRQSARRQSWKWAPEALPDGVYTLALSARDSDGTAAAQLTVVVDRTLARFGVQPAVFSPDGDGVDDTIAFSFELAAPALVSLRVVQYGRSVALAAVGFLAAGPQEIAWDGVRADGPLPGGRYDAFLAAAGTLGEPQLTAPFSVG
ncbi:MAG: N-acetylmuramoyl-L-alanine amidase [Gaiellaceae bacterium]